MYAAASTHATLALMHGFTLTVGEQHVPLVWSGQRLLAFLALANGPVSRRFIAGALWPDTTALKASGNLRTALWRVHRACEELVYASAQQLALCSTVAVDVRDAQAVARRLLDSTAQCDDILCPATRMMLSADILPDGYDDDWLLLEREQFHQLRLLALEAMSERLIAAHRYGEAVDSAMAAIRAEPLRESAHTLLIRAHLGAGNRWAAVRQYQQCRQVLREEIGVDPSPELRCLLPLELRAG